MVSISDQEGIWQDWKDSRENWRSAEMRSSGMESLKEWGMPSPSMPPHAPVASLTTWPQSLLTMRSTPGLALVPLTDFSHSWRHHCPCCPLTTIATLILLAEFWKPTFFPSRHLSAAVLCLQQGRKMSCPYWKWILRDGYEQPDSVHQVKAHTSSFWISTLRDCVDSPYLQGFGSEPLLWFTGSSNHHYNWRNSCSLFSQPTSEPGYILGLRANFSV